MLRVAQPNPPLPCYGSEYEAALPRCLQCQYRSSCREATGIFLNKIPLSKAVYSLVPEAIQSRASTNGSPSASDLEAAFQEAHQTVYGSPSRQSVAHHLRVILRGAEDTKTTPVMYLTTLMLSHQQTSNGAPFHASAVARSDATVRVKALKEACLRKFASYDLKVMDATLGENLKSSSLREAMLADEIAVGSFIVARKITTGGNSAAAVFQAMETQLSLDWLAIEEHYQPILLRQSTTSEVLQDRRKRVLLRLGALKQSRSLARSTFLMREAIAPEAVRRVLRQWQLEPKHFFVDDQPITDLFNLWINLGVCLQHWQCLKALDGQPNAYNVTKLP